MIRKLLTSQWKVAMQRLEQINFHKNVSKQYTRFQHMQDLVIKQITNPQQLQPYLKGLKTLQFNPYNLFKSIVLIHLYIQEASSLDETKVMQFLNFLITQCNFLIQIHSQIETKGLPKYDLLKTQMSTRQDELYLCKQNFLISTVVKTYIGYICKLVTNFELYKQLKKKPQIQQHVGWMIINLLKTITGFSHHFTIIGRYYMKDYGYLVILIMRVLSKDIIILSDCLRNLAFHQNCILTCVNFNNKTYQVQIQEFMNMLNQIASLNQNLMQLYLGKYFYPYICNLQQPKWININDSQFDTFFKIHRQYKEIQNQEKSIQQNKNKCIQKELKE